MFFRKATKTSTFPSSFGGAMPGRSYNLNNYRYNYQGQELADNMNWQNFELRMHNTDLGRWMSPDPYGQFFSPYVSMGNNPVSSIDPDGGQSTDRRSMDTRRRQSLAGGYTQEDIQRLSWFGGDGGTRDWGDIGGGGGEGGDLLEMIDAKRKNPSIIYTFDDLFPSGNNRIRQPGDVLEASGNIVSANKNFYDALKLWHKNHEGWVKEEQKEGGEGYLSDDGKRYGIATKWSVLEQKISWLNSDGPRSISKNSENGNNQVNVEGEPLISGIYNNSWDNLGYHMRNFDRSMDGLYNKTHQAPSIMKKLIGIFPPTSVLNGAKTLITGSDIYNNQKNGIIQRGIVPVWNITSPWNPAGEGTKFMLDWIFETTDWNYYEKK